MVDVNYLLSAVTVDNDQALLSDTCLTMYIYMELKSHVNRPQIININIVHSYVTHELIGLFIPLSMTW